MSNENELAHFFVTGLEESSDGLFLAIPRDLPVASGMAAWSWSHGPRAPEFLIIDVVRPTDRNPAILLPRAARMTSIQITR